MGKLFESYLSLDLVSLSDPIVLKKDKMTAIFEDHSSVCLIRET